MSGGDRDHISLDDEEDLSPSSSLKRERQVSNPTKTFLFFVDGVNKLERLSNILVYLASMPIMKGQNKLECLHLADLPGWAYSQINN